MASIVTTARIPIIVPTIITVLLLFPFPGSETGWSVGLLLLVGGLDGEANEIVWDTKEVIDEDGTSEDNVPNVSVSGAGDSTGIDVGIETVADWDMVRLV